MSDPQILELFKHGHRQKAFTELYRLYPRIEKLILSKGGTKVDAQDVFQEALIILYRKLNTSGFQLTASFYTYLYSVARFYWKDVQQKQSKQPFLEDPQDEIGVQETIKREHSYRIAENAFLELGLKCQQLLKFFYHQRMSFIDIAKEMGFSSEKSAKNQKYKCLQKARDIFILKRNNFQY